MNPIVIVDHGKRQLLYFVHLHFSNCYFVRKGLRMASWIPSTLSQKCIPCSFMSEQSIVRFLGSSWNLSLSGIIHVIPLSPLLALQLVLTIDIDRLQHFLFLEKTW